MKKRNEQETTWNKGNTSKRCKRESSDQQRVDKPLQQVSDYPAHLLSRVSNQAAQLADWAVYDEEGSGIGA